MDIGDCGCGAVVYTGQERGVRLAIILLLLFLSVVGYAYYGSGAKCGNCHGNSNPCSCHTISLSNTAHQMLNSATLDRSPPPPNQRRGDSPSYCSCHWGIGGQPTGGRGMSPSCVCHAVIHVNLAKHGAQHISEVLVEGYLPLINPPYVSPTLVYKQAKIWYNCTNTGGRTPGNCPPNLYNLVTGLYNTFGTGSTNIVVVALWDWYVGDVVLSLPGRGPTGLAGAYGNVGDNSWVSCFVCHFVYTSPWYVAGIYNTTKSTNQISRFVQHPDTCQPCHGVSANVRDNTIRTSVWAHNILGYKVNGPDAIWSNCGVCHSAINNVVSTSVHYQVGCKCHSVVHIGYNYNGWLTGLYTFVGSTGGATPPFETVPSIARLAMTYTPLNASKVLGYLVGNITSASAGGRNVEVGLWDAYSKDYLSTLFYIGTPIGKYGLGPERVWTACFNCHFTAFDPSKAADPHAIGWRLGVENNWDTSTTPYKIGAERGGGGAGYVKFYAGLLLVFSLLGGGLVWLRKK